MLVDSHCHLQLLDLNLFSGQLANVIAQAKKNGVGHLLCVAVNLADRAIRAR